MIEFSQVTKQYGKVKALDSISFSLSKGRIIGLFGPNGAGKSTALKLIAGLSRPDRGKVEVDGQNPQAAKSKIAYLPEVDYLYPWMTIEGAACFIKAFYPDWDEHKYKELMHFLNLEPDMKINKISKGQRSKAKLLLAVSRRASYLLLDEPLSGVDILSREEIINTLIRDYREGEQTIVIATHEIGEVENLVDEVVFVKRGKIVLKQEAEVIRQERGKSLVETMKELMKGE
ncbi:ABC-2 type transport system ATP-binding protein [Thermosyntropha lipolytica DSM 11003]|uniref:ABC-2 type transport system ATP-binding protein n=1 Tax=Thermosyntropha lipolytica DSM 11003 TaxID=1123382 RepID=A0A1M5JNS7_9FIRM|nr:ABC transporter ATP-binding protein [Thermosyntropha lipolytica]SHG42246.1 ABC-2 type transport system ATP-binding protein [Thermosyntropha lipolytica DSM 11003]